MFNYLIISFSIFILLFILMLPIPSTQYYIRDFIKSTCNTSIETIEFDPLSKIIIIHCEKEK